jgi:hypothetical protein
MADVLQYCLCDFDLSMILPPDTDRNQYRPPFWLSQEELHDTSQGEFEL